ncbi:MAG: PaaI family thioesterase [Dysosmobacter sp.]
MTQQEQIWQDVMELANRPGTFTHGLGLHVTGIGDGWAEGELTAGAGMLNPLGIVHGGVYAAMMDHVAGTAACSRGKDLPDGELRLCISWLPAQPGPAASPGGERPHGAADRGDAGLVEDAQGVRRAEGRYTFRRKPAEHKG